MKFEDGVVVRSIAGRDKGKYFVVIASDSKYASICDGRYRTLEKPKRKNKKHLCFTLSVLSQDAMGTNKTIYEALRGLSM